MPAEFDKCINTPGSEKFTKKLPDGQYVHGCKMPGSKKAVWGEVKKREPRYTK
jgi:hypothetical protein